MRVAHCEASSKDTLISGTNIWCVNTDGVIQATADPVDDVQGRDS
jgi:hypothetical protein